MLHWVSGHTRQKKNGNECIREEVGAVTIVYRNPEEFNFTLSDFGMCGDL